ncbi:hypothetical protein BDZ97DRAFT_1818231 [Flammula alnicola]|nr:hypothetical protein BDZ97DRAFT_1818231 [Flammula alnicola]
MAKHIEFLLQWPRLVVLTILCFYWRPRAALVQFYSLSATSMVYVELQSPSRLLPCVSHDAPTRASGLIVGPHKGYMCRVIARYCRMVNLISCACAWNSVMRHIL